MTTDYETSRANVEGTYLHIEAVVVLELRAVCSTSAL